MKHSPWYILVAEANYPQLYNLLSVFHPGFLIGLRNLSQYRTDFGQFQGRLLVVTQVSVFLSQSSRQDHNNIFFSSLTKSLLEHF